MLLFGLLFLIVQYLNKTNYYSPFLSKWVGWALVILLSIAYNTSVSGTRHISDAIKERKPFSLVDHNAKMAEATSTMQLQQQDQIKLDSLLLTLDTKQVRAIQRAITFKTSSWLTVLPTTYHHFDLSATEFGDADIIDLMDVVQL